MGWGADTQLLMIRYKESDILHNLSIEREVSLYIKAFYIKHSPTQPQVTMGYSTSLLTTYKPL
jgi:hypothetical protein